MAARLIQQWFDEYGESHRNPVNVVIHWIAVPLIFFSIVGLLASIPRIPVPYLGAIPVVNLALLALYIFYIRYSLILFFGMAVFASLCLGAANWIDVHAGWPLWAISLGIFIVAWVAQFIGHHLEGKKPSFLKDLQFLLIGPAWLLAKLLTKIGVRY
ncbi:MAG: Mpo1-like protein [Flavobacteriales bacterium]